MKSTTDIEKTLRKTAKVAAGAALGAVGAYYGTIFFGIMDYLYQPECFRAGEAPEPSTETAPGKVILSPEQAFTTDGRQVVTLTFVAGPGGVSEDGGIKMGLCHLSALPGGARRPDFQPPFGWGLPQNTRPGRPNYFNVRLETSGTATLEVERMPAIPIRFVLRIFSREWMKRHGSKLNPLDYGNLVLEQSKVKVKVRGGRLNEGDKVILTVGAGKSGGWKIPELPSRTDFLVEVDERTLGRYRLLAELPSMEIVKGTAVSL